MSSSLRKANFREWRISYNYRVLIAISMSGENASLGPVRVEVADTKDPDAMRKLPKDVREFIEDAGWPDVLMVMES